MNELSNMIAQADKKTYRIADKIGMSRSYLYALSKKDEMPRNVLLETLDKIAKELGYTVKVEFVKE